MCPSQSESRPQAPCNSGICIWARRLGPIRLPAKAGVGPNYDPRVPSHARPRRKFAMMDGTNRRLMFHGMFLFLLGLLTGFAEQHFANVRMGLAAHLEGLMNGTFLVALGAIWIHVRLSPSATTVAY